MDARRTMGGCEEGKERQKEDRVGGMKIEEGGGKMEEGGSWKMKGEIEDGNGIRWKMEDGGEW